MEEGEEEEEVFQKEEEEEVFQQEEFRPLVGSFSRLQEAWACNARDVLFVYALALNDIVFPKVLIDG